MDDCGKTQREDRLLSCHRHHFSKANDHGTGEPLYYGTSWHKGNLSGVSTNRDYLHKPVIRTQCQQATCKTSYQLLRTENETIKQHDLSVRGKKKVVILVEELVSHQQHG